MQVLIVGRRRLGFALLLVGAGAALYYPLPGKVQCSGSLMWCTRYGCLLAQGTVGSARARGPVATRNATTRKTSRRIDAFVCLRAKLTAQTGLSFLPLFFFTTCRFTGCQSCAQRSHWAVFGDCATQLGADAGAMVGHLSFVPSPGCCPRIKTVTGLQSRGRVEMADAWGIR